MSLNSVFPASVQLDTMSVTDTTVDLVLRSAESEATCPACGQSSHTIHSRYVRTLADLPWAGLSVRIQLHARTFFCHIPTCQRAIFTERLPQRVLPYARRTLRLRQAQRSLGLELGGEAGARTARQQGLPTSPDTLLRLVRQAPARQRAPPRVLGVDDWALRKGQVYGTILVDLEQHQPIALLPDRRADRLAEWLQSHPGVEIISRDRATAYAAGALRGAPNAIHVADRLHLLQNVRAALQRFLERNQALLRQAAVVPAPEPAPVHESPSERGEQVATQCAQAQAPSRAARRTRAERRKMERRERRHAR